MRLEWEQDGQYYQTIENFWKDDKNRQASTWIEHREINMVMLATSLAPGRFLMI